jgi:SH3 domain-containing YSC84-like protein 1
LPQLTQQQGLAVITVFKAGFLGSVRGGSGIVVARLSDGSWSAPSAVGTAGGGFGGQIGFELTDFVFILNDSAAVQAFAQRGSITLGGNVSIAAGPVGRNAEAAGAASMKGVAGVFSYSKTKGLFAGVSLEGSVLIERRDANEKLYNGRITARQLLEGAIRPPPAADPLMRVLNSRVFSGAAGGSDSMYNDIPVYDDGHDDVVWEGRTGAAYGQGTRNNRSSTIGSNQGGHDDYEYRDNPKRANTWQDEVYDRPNENRSSRANPNETFDTLGRSRASTLGDNGYAYNDNKPTRPTAPKPVFKQKTGNLAKDQAVALFTFDSEQEGDLGFKKGDIITITKRTDNKTDWWTGRTEDGRVGIFPSNYIESVT